MKKNASFSAVPPSDEAMDDHNHESMAMVETHQDDDENDVAGETVDTDDASRKHTRGNHMKGRRMFSKSQSSTKNASFSQLSQSEDVHIQPSQSHPSSSNPHHTHFQDSMELDSGITSVPNTTTLVAVPAPIPIRSSLKGISHYTNKSKESVDIRSSNSSIHPPVHTGINSSHSTHPDESHAHAAATTTRTSYPTPTVDPYLDSSSFLQDASDDDIILSLVSNTLFLWGALFVLIVSLWDLTDLKLQSDTPLILFDDNTQPYHEHVNVGLYNAASLLGPIFYFLNAIFDYLWALFVKEKISLYAKYLGRMDPLWDILYGVFFGLGAIMDLIHASISISIARWDGDEDDYESFFILFSICSTFFYLVSGLFFLFAVEFTTCKHPVKMVILLGDCLFLAGSAMDFLLSLISDPDIVIEDQIRIAHGHILSNTFWTINAALYLCADVIVWCTQRKPTSSTPVDELVNIVMKDLTLDRRLSRYSSSSSHRRMSSWRVDGVGSGNLEEHPRCRRATMASIDDGVLSSSHTRSRLTTWDFFMSRPIVVPESSSVTNLNNSGEGHPIPSISSTSPTHTINNTSSSSWDILFLSRPRSRRATLGTVEDVNELELT